MGFWKCPGKLEILNLKCQYYNLPLLNKSKLVDVQFGSEQFNTKEALGKEPQKVNYFLPDYLYSKNGRKRPFGDTKQKN